MVKIMPWLTGTACLFYCVGWYWGITYPAYVPLIWAIGCFVNDIYNYLETKYD